MPAHRKPTKLLIAGGTAKKNPARIRARAAEPVNDGTDLRQIPAPPHLSAAQRQIWTATARQLPEGVAMATDALAFEALVRLIERSRESHAPQWVAGRMLNFLRSFGMTPATRGAVRPLANAPNSFGALRDA